MKLTASLLFLAVGCLASDISCADPADDYRDAQRIVVITDSEGIHYAHFCAFYELRDLIAQNVDNDVVAIGEKTQHLYEIRVLGRFGERVVYVGDHWIRTVEHTAMIPIGDFGRIVQLIEKRRGQGVSPDKLELSVERARKQLRKPAYVEDNRCLER